MWKPWTMWITINWKILQEMGIPDHLTCLLRNMYANQEGTIRTKQHEQLTGSKWGKEYDRAVYCYPVYSAYVRRVHHLKWQAGWSTSWNQDCQEKYQKHRICRWYHSNGRKWKGTKEPLDESERGEWKAGLKLSIQNTKIMASSPITSWQTEGEKAEAVTNSFLGLQMVTSAWN